MSNEQTTDVTGKMEQIRALKRERNAAILAHYYQIPEIQDVADFVGDSLQLAQQAKSTTVDVICFAGVHFMAETAKILNPDKVVVVPDISAGCSLADGCPVDDFRKWRQAHPGAVCVTYINCSAAIKAESDYICTSANAADVVKAIPPDKEVLFAPDRNLGNYVTRVTGRKMQIWDGSCVVHDRFSASKIGALLLEQPDAVLIAHPECGSDVLELAEFVGSTTALLAFAKKTRAKALIVATEPGVLHPMRRLAPDKRLMTAPVADGTCAECGEMKRNNLDNLFAALRDLRPRVEVAEPLMSRARVPIERMFTLR